MAIKVYSKNKLFFFFYTLIIVFLFKSSLILGQGQNFPANCKEPDANNTSICAVCNDKYYLKSDGTCASCSSGCSSCEAGNKCTKCDSGFELVQSSDANSNTFGGCIKTSSDKNCLKWSIGSGENEIPHCLKCKQGYIYKYTGKCEPMTETEKSYVQRIRIRAINNNQTSSTRRLSEGCPIGINPNFKGIDLDATNIIINGQEKNKDEIQNLSTNNGEVVVLEFNTKLQTFEEMFKDCTNIEDVSFENVNSENVKSMKGMFEQCINLRSVSMPGIDTKQVTDMSKMFEYCSKLGELDLRSFDIQNTQNITRMFAECGNLQSLDVSSFNPPKKCDMTDVFYGSAKGVKGLILNKNFVEALPGDTSEMTGVIYEYEEQKKRYKTHYIVFLCIFILFFLLTILMIVLLITK